jgi:hypothetical protein
MCMHVYLHSDSLITNKEKLLGEGGVNTLLFRTYTINLCLWIISVFSSDPLTLQTDYLVTHKNVE